MVSSFLPISLFNGASNKGHCLLARSVAILLSERVDDDCGERILVKFVVGRETMWIGNLYVEVRPAYKSPSSGKEQANANANAKRQTT